MTDDQKPIDRLMEGTRIKGESRMILDGTKPQNVTREQARRVIAEATRMKDSCGLKWKEIARAIGCGSGVFSAVINQNYIGDWQGVIVDLDKWVEEEQKRQLAPKPTEFVRTKVAEEVFTVADAVTTLKCIGLVFGWAGIGKTKALRAVAAEKPGSIFISIKTATATSMGVLQQIAEGCGLRDCYNANQRGLTLRLEQLLRGTPRLIIIDEIHKLCGGRDDKVLHVLRDLHDATGDSDAGTGVPMLWSGTTDLIGYLERRQAGGREPLAQIRRRIGICRDLTERTYTADGGPGEPLYSVEEIRKVFAKSKMRLAPDAAKYLFMLANLPDCGGLGGCKNLIVMATKVHERHGDVLTADMLRGVHRLLVNRRAYGLLETRMEETTAPRPIARAG